MKVKYVVSLVASGLTMFSMQALAAQGTGTATMNVISAVSVTNVSNLIFSDAAAGTSAETVAAGSSETAQNASFNISGQAGKAILVTLPADSTVNMAVNGGGTPDTQIAVNQFTSNNPSQIGANGTTSLFVGATRSALTATQTPGAYQGSFVVNVVYQ